MPIELHTDHLRQELAADTIVCEVIRHDSKRRHRLVNIVSVKNTSRSVQTIAYTLLTPRKWTGHIANIDKLLKEGSLMGETFRKHGFSIHQNRLFRIRLPLMNRYFAQLFHCRPWSVSEVEIYEFWADSVLYGLVVEIKHPDRKPIDRDSAGYHATLNYFGPHANSLHIFLAKVAGVAVGAYLYLRARSYAYYWTYRYAMFMKQR